MKINDDDFQEMFVIMADMKDHIIDGNLLMLNSLHQELMDIMRENIKGELPEYAADYFNSFESNTQ